MQLGHVVRLVRLYRGEPGVHAGSDERLHERGFVRTAGVLGRMLVGRLHSQSCRRLFADPRGSYGRGQQLPMLRHCRTLAVLQLELQVEHELRKLRARLARLVH